MSELLSQTDKDKLNQRMVEMLPHYGWPPWFPNKPPQLNSEWWQEETTILPEGFRLPNIRLVEFTGLPQGGKSSLLEKLKEELRSELTGEGWQIEFWEEGLESVPETAQHFSFFPMPGVTPIFYKDRRDWAAPLFIQKLNHILWTRRIAELDRITEPDERKFILGFRGPVDISVWYFSQAAHQGDPNFTIPDWYREEELINWGWVLAHNQPLISDLDALILIGISQEEAQERRKLAKKDYPGWVVDSPIFPELAAWYEYFIRKVYPRINELKEQNFAESTGLLILNGEADIEENLERVSSYCRQMIENENG